LGDTIIGPYKENGKGVLSLGEDEGVREKVIERIKETEEDDQEFGGFNCGDFDTEEIYVDMHSKELHVSGNIGDFFVMLNIPIKECKETKQMVKDLAELTDMRVGETRKETGLFLKPDDFEEVRKKTADAQGRINMGVERAGKDVKVVVLD